MIQKLKKKERKNEMKETIKNFPTVLKKYIDAIMKMNFGELMIHFFELLILLVIASFLYIPIGLLKDILFTVFTFFTFEASEALNVVVDLIIKVLSFLFSACCFIYMFTKRYEELKKEKREVSKQEQGKPSLEEIDLPKEK